MIMPVSSLISDREVQGGELTVLPSSDHISLQLLLVERQHLLILVHLLDLVFHESRRYISTLLHLDMDGILLVEFRNLLFKFTENKETAFFGPLRLLRIVAGKATKYIAL